MAALNHLIVWSKDKRASAKFLGDVLGVPVGAEWGPFIPVKTSNGVTIDFVDGENDVRMQHYAFLVDDAEFDAAAYLDDETAIAAYLTDILEANDAALLASALGDIARARGMTDFAKSAGIAREALYKALRPGSAPRFDTVSRVCAALGVRLVAQPVKP